MCVCVYNVCVSVCVCVFVCIMCVCVCVIHTRSQTHTHTDTRARTHTRRTKQTLQVPLDTIGHDLEHHSFFPERCNVSVVTVAADKKSIRMRVWERGAGITEACGTGACATLVNAVRRGYIGKEQVSVCVCVREREREREREKYTGKKQVRNPISILP